MEKTVSLNQTQLVNIIRIPLHHFPTPFHIQGMVINPANIVLVHVSDLEFNPVRVESFIVQDGAERMPEAMPYYPPLIPSVWIILFIVFSLMTFDGSFLPGNIFTYRPVRPCNSFSKTTS